MKKRNWLALLLALAMVLALAGCSGGNFTAESLTVWIWDEGEEQTWDTLAQDWADRNGVSVEIEVIDEDSYWEEVASGDLPDILWVDTAHAQECIEEGLIQSLEEYLGSGSKVKVKDYYSQLMPAFQSDGETYALPKDSSVTALWYNKTLFDRAGLSYPDESWTWETLYTNALALTSRSSGVYGIAIDVTDTTDGWYNLVYAYGGALVSEDEDGNRTSSWSSTGTVQAMNLLADLIADCMPSQAVMEQMGTTALFTSGHVAMILQSSEEALELVEESGAANWGCVQLPYYDLDGSGSCETGERVSVVTGTAWAISSTAADGAAAYDLLQTLAGEEGQNAESAANLAQPAMTGLGEAWGVSLTTGDFTPYRTTLSEGTLVAAPLELEWETWEDYALAETMYIAWNNPDEMTNQLAAQETYTTASLIEAATAAAEAAAAEAETAEAAETESSTETTDDTSTETETGTDTDTGTETETETETDTGTETGTGTDTDTGTDTETGTDDTGEDTGTSEG